MTFLEAWLAMCFLLVAVCVCVGLMLAGIVLPYVFLGPWGLVISILVGLMSLSAAILAYDA